MNIEGYLKRDYIRNLVAQGKRMDDRAFDQIRPLFVETGYSKEKADGSAYVKLGETEVIVGISLDKGTPYPDRPNSGVLTTSAELRPIADPQFELGPPRAESIELARVVDRGIRESGAVEVDKLKIDEENVWVVFVDLHILNNHGNLIDASGIAAIAALLDTRMPKIEEGEIIRGDWTGEKLPVKCVPIPVTSAKIGKNIVVDPSLEEEYAMDARLTVATSGDSIHAMQKGDSGSLSQEDVRKIVDLSFQKGEEVRKLLPKI
ncbi:MAG: exosome complex protein Rrp42 [Candidatus Altiarchaeota archaeon]